MLVVFSPIFVANTEIITRHNFAASLKVEKIEAVFQSLNIMFQLFDYFKLSYFQQ